MVQDAVAPSRFQAGSMLLLHGFREGVVREFWPYKISGIRELSCYPAVAKLEQFQCLHRPETITRFKQCHPSLCMQQLQHRCTDGYFRFRQKAATDGYFRFRQKAATAAAGGCHACAPMHASATLPSSVLKAFRSGPVRHQAQSAWWSHSPAATGPGLGTWQQTLWVLTIILTACKAANEASAVMHKVTNHDSQSRDAARSRNVNMLHAARVEPHTWSVQSNTWQIACMGSIFRCHG
eukprot:359054-Chlamydomonas_euryale.AAC.3